MPTPKILKSAEAAAYRATRPGIGASEVAAIMEIDPWRSAYELFQIKTGRIKQSEPNKAMLAGLAREEEAIAFASEKGRYSFLPQIIAQHDEFPFIYASADGWDPVRRIGVEVKCPTSPQTINYLQENGEPPQHYYMQLCQQVSVFSTAVGWEFLVYHTKDTCRSYLAVGVLLEEMRRFWKDEIFPRLQFFQDAVERGEWPQLTGKAVPHNSADFDRECYMVTSIKRQIEKLDEEKETRLSHLRLMSLARIVATEHYRTEWRRSRRAWKVIIDCDDREAAAAVLRAVEPLRSSQEVRSIKEQEKIENLSFFVSDLDEKN
jgi:putative phage-type endonuclease